MKMKRAVTTPLTLALIALLAANGCARLRVAPPESVAGLNDADWQIQQRRSKDAPAPEPISPLPPRLKLRPPEIGTPVDKHGIPVGLYGYDPMLRSYLEMAEARAASHHAAGTGTVAFGVLTGALGGLILLIGAQSEQNHPEKGSQGGTYVLASMEGVLALGLIIAGITQLATGPDTRALERYAHETYDLPPRGP